MSNEKPRILFIPFEFLAWERGGAWPYGIHLGVEEGLEAHGINFMTLPATYELPSSYPASWLYHARRLCAGQKFDQVWFFLRHAQFDEAFLDWVAEIAPVRVGYIMESLVPTPEQLEVSPQLAELEMFMQRQMQYMTHILAFDERDCDDIRRRGGRALWCPWAIPQRFLALPPAFHREPKAAFLGAVYGKREQFLNHPSLQNILARLPKVEEGSELPGLFDNAAMYYHARLHNGELLSPTDLHEYLMVIRRIRRTVFDQYLAMLSRQAANVVLPANFRGYSNRIVESAAARVPVISWDVPDRSRNQMLFEPEHDILLFDPDSPESLAACIRRILDEPEFARYLARNLHEKVLFHHTMEVRVGEILRWIDAGVEPHYMRNPETEFLDASSV
jgi:glycosyltransferase involved in cell wall biosynthesis